MENLEVRQRKNIKKRFNIIVKSCVSLRCMSHCFVMSNQSIWFDVKTLKSSWDIDRRPEIRGSKIEYFNTKAFSILNENRELITFKKLTSEEVSIINNYVEIMVPRPLSESVLV